MNNNDLFDEIMIGLNEAAAYAKGDRKVACENHVTVSEEIQSIYDKTKWNKK